MNANDAGFGDAPDEIAWVRALARRLVAAPEDAEDLEQEAWLAVLRLRPRAHAGLRPWLATVLRNGARRAARTQRHRQGHEARSARAEALPSAQELAQRAELARALVAHILRLDEPFRSTVLLCFQEGLAPREVARRQGIPAATVRSRLARGLAELRVRLDVERGRERWLAVLFALDGAAAEAVVPRALAAAGLGMLALVGALAFVTWARAQRDESLSVAAAALPATEASAPSAPASPPGPPARRESLPSPASELSCRVRLLDALTGEPLPDYRVAPRTGAPQTELVSDTQGELVLALAPGARLAFDLPENVGPASEAGDIRPRDCALERSEGAPQPLELRVPAGPTYRLVLVRPPGYALADLRATLAVRGNAPPREELVADVRAGAVPWVRFSPAALRLPAAEAWTLRVTTADGLWAGEAEVAEREGRVSTPVAIEFAARARLRVRDPSGAPLPQASLRGEALAGASAPTRATFARSGAELVASALVPGAWELVARAAGHVEARERVELAALEERRIDLVLLPAPAVPRARLAGRLESASGRYRDSAYPRLTPLDGSGARGAPLEWREEHGRVVGLFAGDVPAPGRYRVEVDVPGFLAVEPPFVELEAGDPPARFLLRDDVTLSALELRARDDEGPLAFRVRLTVETANGPRRSDSGEPRAEVRFEGVPRGARCRTLVFAAGHCPAEGELLVEDLARPLEVHLERGFGFVLVACDGAGRPLAGARIEGDGAALAETDAAGRALVALARAPRTLRITYRDWRPRASARLAPDGALAVGADPELEVVLEPVR